MGLEQTLGAVVVVSLAQVSDNGVRASLGFLGISHMPGLNFGQGLSADYGET